MNTYKRSTNNELIHFTVSKSDQFYQQNWTSVSFFGTISEFGGLASAVFGLFIGVMGVAKR